MQYTNVKLPIDTLYQTTVNDVSDLVRMFAGHDCTILYSPSFPSTGSSGYGPWEEGDIEFVDGEEICYLAYDFMQLNKSEGRIFRYEIDRHALNED